MNPGVGEEVGKIAASAIDALRSTPAVLALLVFNLIFMVILGYVSIKSSERWDKEIDRWEKLVHACQNIPKSD